MKTSSAQLKLRARQALLGNYGLVLGAQLGIYGITMGVGIVMEIVMIIGMIAATLINEGAMAVLPFVVMILFYLIIFMLELMLMPGLIRIYMNICRGEKAQIGELFFAFKNHPGKFILIAAAIGVFAVILMVPMLVIMSVMRVNEEFAIAFFLIYWVLTMVLMVYVGLTYGMFYIILIEDPEKSAMEALTESRHLMKGNRWRCFCLGFSFIGMILLGYMTVGVGFLWLMPYIICTSIMFYFDLKPKMEVYPPEWQANAQPPQWEMTPQAPVYQQPEFQETQQAPVYQQPEFQETQPVQPVYQQPVYQEPPKALEMPGPGQVYPPEFQDQGQPDAREQAWQQDQFGQQDQPDDSSEW